MPRRRSRPDRRGLRAVIAISVGCQHLLRGKGQPGARDRRHAGAEGLEFRRRQPRRDRAVPRQRRHGRAAVLRQYDQEGKGHRLCLSGGGAAFCLRQRGRTRKAGAPGARRARVLPHSGLVRGSGLAAVAQIRLHPGNGRQAACRGPPARARPLWRVVPCRLAADRSRAMGPRHRGGRAHVHPARRNRHQPQDGQYRRRVPGAVPGRGRLDRALCPGGHRRLDPPFRQPPARDHRRARALAGRRCRAHPERGHPDFRQGRRRGQALGLPRCRQVQRARRNHGRMHPVPHPGAGAFGPRRGR